MVKNVKIQTSNSLLSYSVRIIDALCVISCAFFAHFFYLKDTEFSSDYTLALILATLLTLLIFPLNGVYQSWRGKSTFSQVKAVSTSWIIVTLTLILISSLLKNTAIYSRVWFGIWAFSTWFGLFLIRYLLNIFLKIIRKKGWNKKKIVIFGAGVLGQTVVSRLQKAKEAGYDIVNFFDDKSDIENTNFNNIKILNGNQLDETFITENQIEELWIALPLSASERLKEILFKLRHSFVTIRYIPDLFGLRLLNHSVTIIEGLPLLNFNHAPIFGLNRVLKFFEDFILATIFLIFSLPVMIIIAVLIKLESKGPILFKQIRLGRDGRKIKVYKFRTMKVHEEETNQVTQATKGDSRITKIGSFLRKTSLDELPQFFNVLQGRMSIVGPRPHAIPHNQQFKDEIMLYMQRHKVKPGITGWAQINGWRGETDTLEKMQKRVEHDLFYIDNWSILFDLYIITLTFFKGFVNRNAY